MSAKLVLMSRVQRWISFSLYYMFILEVSCLLYEKKCLPSICYSSIQELFARLLVLLHDPLSMEQLATQILTVSIPYLWLGRPFSTIVSEDAKENFARTLCIRLAISGQTDKISLRFDRFGNGWLLCTCF